MSESVARPNVLQSFVRNVKAIGTERWGDWWGYIFISPLVIKFLLFEVYTRIRGLMMCLQDYRFYDRETWSFLNSFIGLGNFIEIFTDPDSLRGIKAAILFQASWFPITFALSLFTAVMLSRVKDQRIASIYRVLITLAWVIPISSALPMWQQIYEPNFGYLTNLVKRILKIWPNPPNWTYHPFWYWASIGVACCWKGFGYYALLFLIGLYNIPQEVHDAAVVDGASGWEKFWLIELPMIRNIMIVFLATNLGFLAGGTIEGLIFGTGPHDIGITFAGYGYRKAFFGDMRLGYGAAIDMTIGLSSALIAFLVFRGYRSEKA